MVTELDLETWPRRQAYAYFRSFDHPWFNVCSQIEVTQLLAYLAGRPRSLFLTSLYLVLRAVNEEEALRYRFSATGDRVLVHDIIHGGGVLLNEDESFGFCYFHYQPNFEAFYTEAHQHLEESSAKRVPFDPRLDQQDIIHTSVLPWISFTSVSHARRHGRFDAVPKLTFGRIHDAAGRQQWPVSIEAHHALVDGLHVGRFFQRLQDFANRPNEVLA